MTSRNTARVAPKGEGRSATLILPRGAANLHVRAGGGEDLATGSFSGHQPEITSSGSTVFVRYPRGAGRTRGELRLNRGMEWAIESGRGIAAWTADLTGLELATLRIAGGASRVWLNLPRPEHRVHIEVDKGVDRVSIVRPAEIGAVLQLEDGASNLVFDNQRIKAISGELRLESDLGDPTAGTYQITIKSGASRLSVGTSQRVAGSPGMRRMVE